ncbi:lipopolysaccharide biosynthesis protein [Acinetobacter soli]|uniref:lipopolysaccharide biosynthesis protein n=1 Tax=Acinetobacter soli TaxID=487316 RepID=UPI00300CBAED
MNIKTANIITLGSILGAGIGFFTIPIITWFFTQEDIGRFSLYQLALNLGMILISLDMHQSYVREYYDSENKAEILRNALIPGTIFFIVIVIFLIVTKISLSNLLFGFDSKLINFLLIIGVYITFIINILVHVIRMYNFAWAFSFAQVVPKLGYILCLISIVYICQNYNFELLIFTNIFVLSLTVFCLLFFLKDEVFKAIKIKTNSKKLKQMLAFSLPLVVGSLSYWALTSIDRIFLKKFSNFEELALYAVASTLAGGVGVFVTVFSNLWHPIVYKWVNEGIDINKVININELMVVLVCILWSLVGMFSWISSFFFPQSYNGVSIILVGCVAMPLLYMLSETTVIGIGLTKKTIYAMIAILMSLFLNIIINYFLISKYGSKAATVASMSAFVLFLILRTEFSSSLWISLPRKKMYFSIFMYYFFTLSVISGFLNNTMYNTIAWLGLLLVVCTMYYKRLRLNLNYVLKVRKF